MAKQDFEKFKKEIKAWLDTHQDEYDAFVADINSKSYQSIQRIYALGIKMTPKLMAKSMWKARQLFLACFRGSITESVMKRWSSDWKPTLMIPIVAER